MKLNSWMLAAALLAGTAVQAQPAVSPEVQAARDSMRAACAADHSNGPPARNRDRPHVRAPVADTVANCYRLLSTPRGNMVALTGSGPETP
jgi:hypothetical protein